MTDPREVTAPTTVAAAVWLAALAWAVLGPSPTVRLGASATLVAAAAAMSGSLTGQVAALLTLALLGVRGVRDDSVALLALGAVGTALLVPPSLAYWYPGRPTLAVPVTLVVIATGLVASAVVVTGVRLRQA